ncbi:BREX-1 system adenine-specific DNA-methyltransferase PglX [Brotaphodocola sp.]|uniref:BREX-1 system adenine-specific DNA-methyltransferase PglX n=1 Tax=Brotaphodocola sp. TaxID=3073577 RepID=UPI003D7CB865
MNKTAIKNFAIWARNKLIKDVSYRAKLIGITEEGIAEALPQSTSNTKFYDIGTAEPYAISNEEIHQRDKLVEVIRKQEQENDGDYESAYHYIIEEFAFTWFNRLIALRFMEVNDYLPSHIRVLSSESGKLEPDLVTNPFDADLSFTASEEAEILQLKQENKLDEVFRILFFKQCNALSEILPGLFERNRDYTELLLSLSVVDQDGVVWRLLHDIPEDDFNVEQGGQVEIIGWLYQYYNTEPKAAAFAKKEKIRKEEIPAVTQLFTPDWIVRYMVENSLGRLWVEGHPENSSLKENWKYYLEEAEQEPEVQEKLAEIRKEYATLSPEDIKIIDPCMGSGHILVYAFDVLMQIYESAGYSQRDAAKSILENNIYGLDIDDRAYQLAYFAVMMKARQYNRRVLNGENTCHVYAIQESNEINRAHLKYLGAGMDEIEKNTAKLQLEGLLNTFIDAKEYGSILNVENYDWDLLRRFVAGADTNGQITIDNFGLEDTVAQLLKLIDIGETMARKYWVTVTNPPYMASSGMGKKLLAYVKKYYDDGRNDLYTVFILKCHKMCKSNAILGMITQLGWMSLTRSSQLRKVIYLYSHYINMIHLGARVFEELSGEVVKSSAFILRQTELKKYKACYYKLDNTDDKEKDLLSHRNKYEASLDETIKIEGAPLSYWLPRNMLPLFENSVIKDYFICRAGMQTGDNEQFLRLWYEVEKNKTDHFVAGTKWFSYNKGGSQRKWYGNLDLVVNWENNGFDIKKFKKHRLELGEIEKKNSECWNSEFYFVEGVTWSSIASGTPMFRLTSSESIFDIKGPTCFAKDGISHEELLHVLGYLNTPIISTILEILSPTLDCNPGTVSRLPYINYVKNEDIIIGVTDCIMSSKQDWDSFETSWDFQHHPLVCNVSTIDEAYNQWQTECDDRFDQLKSNEEELNRIFIDIYGLQDELTPEVEDKDVTVRKADLQRDIKSLLSYAVGCMFGRYSLDVEGLVYAGGEWDSSKYQSFIPDNDNIIPITDEEYLEDDIVSRLCEWLKVVYGEKALEENLDFIAKALGNKGNSSREIIRNYFLSDFFKDHCQTYSVTGSGKRPIYWLFDSGKQNGFKALIYLHRYTPDTIGNLRIDYLHRMQRVYESEINRMQDMIDHSGNSREIAASTKRKEKLTKQLKECREYDEKIGHLALSRIELDLDDGVKVNYRKIQTAQDGKFYEVLADSKNIMSKK